MFISVCDSTEHGEGMPCTQASKLGPALDPTALVSKHFVAYLVSFLSFDFNT